MDDIVEKINALLERSGNRGMVLAGSSIPAVGQTPEAKIAERLRPLPEPQNAASAEPPVVLGEEQRFVFERMERERGAMFVTGKAGTGKSCLLKYFKEHTAKKVAVVAPTGMAAINVGGQTIHSFFKLALGVQHPQQLEEIGETWLRNRLRCIEALVIDEVSMVRADVMDMIDRKMRLANENDLPFGGKQVIMFGDPYQLPPVVDDGIERELPRFFDDNYGSEFFFSAPVIKNHPLRVYELTEMFRQRDDAEFVDILNKIRTGTVSDADIDALNQKCLGDPAEDFANRRYATLVPTNEAASRINGEELRKIDSREFLYEAVIEDRGGKIKALDFQAERYLKLKVGALVVMLDNGAAWVNGTLGVVSYLDNDFIRVTIRDVEHTVGKKTWEKKEYRYDARTKSLSQTVVATFTQYPVKLAWALTIHKSQGQTYDAVAIDMGRGAFECGQAYVALSRCRGMNTLRLLKRIRRADIKVNPNVMEFMRSAGPQKSADGRDEQEFLDMYRQLDGADRRKLDDLLRKLKSESGGEAEF